MKKRREERRERKEGERNRREVFCEQHISIVCTSSPFPTPPLTHSASPLSNTLLYSHIALPPLPHTSASHCLTLPLAPHLFLSFLLSTGFLFSLLPLQFLRDPVTSLCPLVSALTALTFSALFLCTLLFFLSLHSLCLPHLPLRLLPALTHGVAYPAPPLQTHIYLAVTGFHYYPVDEGAFLRSLSTIPLPGVYTPTYAYIIPHFPIVTHAAVYLMGITCCPQVVGPLPLTATHLTPHHTTPPLPPPPPCHHLTTHHITTPSTLRIHTHTHSYLLCTASHTSPLPHTLHTLHTTSLHTLCPCLPVPPPYPPPLFCLFWECTSLSPPHSLWDKAKAVKTENRSGIARWQKKKKRE